jgi:hypothetical protein
MMKPIPTFGFIDEPQFAGPESRAYIAHRLRCWRNARGNLGCRVYLVRRVRAGLYHVQMRAHGAPVARITTR